MEDTVFKVLGEVVAYGGGAAAVSYLIFQFLGKSWIENKFSERLTYLKHQQSVELQRLRIEIDSILNAKIKIQEKEFQYLPEAWQRLDEAQALISSLVSPYQEFPDLDRLDEHKLEEYLDETEFTPSQKNDIRNSHSKNNEYQKLIFWYRYNKVREAIRLFNNFVARNSIYFTPEIEADFKEMSRIFWSSLVSKEVGVNSNDYEMQNKGWKTIQEEAEPLYISIKSKIQLRLHSHGEK